jgi:hypothetical protein
MQGFLGEPHVGAVHLGALLTGVHLHPVDLLLAAVGLGHRGIDHLQHHRSDVEAGAVALDERDDGLIGHVEREVRVDGDLLAGGRHLDVLVHGGTGLLRVCGLHRRPTRRAVRPVRNRAPKF